MKRKPTAGPRRRSPSQGDQSDVELIRSFIDWFNTPAGKFIHKYLFSKPHPIRLENWHKAYIALLNSDVPLDSRTRSFLSEELQRLFFSNPSRARQEHQRKMKALALAAKEQLRAEGMSAFEADQEVADILDISVDALRKRHQRA
jgi:hypothetical protein